MAIYSVLHVRKIKTMVGCIEVLKHNLRRKNGLEAFVDIGKSKENSYAGATDENFLVKYEDQTANLSRKIQRNASHLIEAVVSFSHGYGYGWENNPQLKQKITEYFDATEKFLKTRYGDVIISRCDHFDEKTPHSHFLLVPICFTKDGERKFSSSQFLGGIKGMIDLHDKFHKEVGINFGLERGIRESRATHSDLKNYAEWEKSQKANINKQQDKIEIQQNRLFDLTGDAMIRVSNLAKRELKNDEIEKMYVKQIPEIPFPSATLVENTRKKWRDGIQGMVNSAFKKVIDVMLSYKSKYDDLLGKYQALKVSNKNNCERANKAQKDLLEKPIEEIIAYRKTKMVTKQIEKKTNAVGGIPHGRRG